MHHASLDSHASDAYVHIVTTSPLVITAVEQLTVHLRFIPHEVGGGLHIGIAVQPPAARQQQRALGVPQDITLILHEVRIYVHLQGDRQVQCQSRGAA